MASSWSTWSSVLIISTRVSFTSLAMFLASLVRKRAWKKGQCNQQACFWDKAIFCKTKRCCHSPAVSWKEIDEISILLLKHFGADSTSRGSKVIFLECEEFKQFWCSCVCCNLSQTRVRVSNSGPHLWHTHTFNHSVYNGSMTHWSLSYLLSPLIKADQIKRKQTQPPTSTFFPLFFFLWCTHVLLHWSSPFRLAHSLCLSHFLFYTALQKTLTANSHILCGAAHMFTRIHTTHSHTDTHTSQ